MMVLDGTLKREISRESGNSREEQRAFRAKVRATAEEMSTPEVMERFDEVLVRRGRAAVAAALAVTLTDRAWRTGKWGASWAAQVLEAWKGRPKGESEMDYIIHDGLHPLRIAEYAGSFLRVASEQA